MKSQNIQENQILLKGTVTDKYKGVPVFCDIEIRPEGGTKFKVFSDPKTGKYEQLIKGGLEYELVFYRYNILRQSHKIKYEPNQKYREEENNFTVITLESGVTVYEQDVFEENSAKVKESARAFFDEFKVQMKFHRTVTWDFYVNAFDVVKGKQVQNINLINQRIQTLTSFLEPYKAYLKKINIKAADATSKMYKGLIIKVNQIEPPLEEQFTK